MVISVLAGGLGNQLFQFAFGFRVAQQLQTELRLERHLLESRTLAQLRNYTLRRYELDAFSIDCKAASLSDTLQCLSRALLPSRQSILLRESELTALTRLNAQTQEALCLGYWQSEEYFKSESKALRKQLLFQKRFSDATLAATTLIQSYSEATFVHIRRGDYVTNAKANRHHGLCDETYYRRAVDFIQEQVNNSHFFVFSDDQAWVRRELGMLFGSATYIGHNIGTDSWQDMYLMSLCRHAIVANSSFSWWGAWLNPQSNRIVIAPRNWFAEPSTGSYPVVPKEWHQL